MKLMPMASALISTSPDPGEGVGLSTCRRTSGPPVSATSMASHGAYHAYNMKLARPDIRHPKIVLAGCPALPEGDGDDAGLIEALRQRGLQARWLSWDDPEALRADLVILRATWDYIERLDEFLDVEHSRRQPAEPSRRCRVEHR